MFSFVDVADNRVYSLETRPSRSRKSRRNRRGVDIWTFHWATTDIVHIELLISYLLAYITDSNCNCKERETKHRSYAIVEEQCNPKRSYRHVFEYRLPDGRDFWNGTLQIKCFRQDNFENLGQFFHVQKGEYFLNID